MSPSHDFSMDDQIRLLAQQYGVSPARAMALLAERTSSSEPRSEPRAAIPFPLRFVLPWSALVSDNVKYAPAKDRHGNAKIILREGYREAKAKAKRIAHDLVKHANPVALPLAISVRVYVPDNRPGHDVANFQKCAHDAFEGIIYTKDEWLHDVHWTRCGVDQDRPRAEIEIRVLL